MGSGVGQLARHDEANARVRRKGVLSRTCASVALATSPAIAFVTASGAAAAPVTDVISFKGGVIVVVSSAAITRAPSGSMTFHDPLPPPPPPPIHSDPHPAPPPPLHPDVHHPAPPTPSDPHHHHPPPPPPPDPHPHHHPPPPPPAPAAEQPRAKVPRDEVVSFVEDDSDDQDRDDEQIIDVSQVTGAPTDDLVDAGVTSGSDTSVWDPIHVDPK
jgi:hypothetical protein